MLSTHKVLKNKRDFPSLTETLLVIHWGLLSVKCGGKMNHV